MSVVVTESDASSEEESLEDAAEEVADAAEDMADAIEDAVMDSTTIELVERVTRLEDALALMGATVEKLSSEIEGLKVHEEIQDARDAEAAEAIEEVAAGSADAIQDVAQEIEEASPEITPDEVPASRDHWFFRKRGRKQ